MNDKAHIVIAGHGRSGTNWLLDLLDLSEQTHCRSEVDELTGSPFANLPGRQVSTGHEDVLDSQWDDAVHRSNQVVGARDRMVPLAKLHMPAIERQRFLYRLFFLRRYRRVLGVAFPRLWRSEWRLPSFLCDQQLLADATTVLKLNQVPGWVSWLLSARPQARVLHIVRHPGGMINSWKRRYLQLREEDLVHQQSTERLEQIALAFPSWGEAFGDIKTMSTLELELCYWRYETETIHSAGANRANYFLVRFEDLAKRPVELSREVYSFCGLPWTEQIERIVIEKSEQSRDIADKWKVSLSDTEQQKVADILKSRPLDAIFS